MKRYQHRIAIRIATEEKEKIEQLLLERKFKTQSQAIRAALKELSKNQEAPQSND